LSQDLVTPAVGPSTTTATTATAASVTSRRPGPNHRHLRLRGLRGPDARSSSSQLPTPNFYLFLRRTNGIRTCGSTTSGRATTTRTAAASGPWTASKALATTRKASTNYTYCQQQTRSIFIDPKRPYVPGRGKWRWRPAMPPSISAPIPGDPSLLRLFFQGQSKKNPGPF